ncbi:MAG: glycerophosphodiester phosphodiesterase [Pseudomonadota bacterium]
MKFRWKLNGKNLSMNVINPEFKIIGHRGAAGEFFENSLAGFKHAVSINVDAIELDIREHNGELWVIHDHHLNRLCGLNGVFEDQQDVSALTLGNGEPIPTLRQILDLTWGRIPLNIEIKAVQTLTLLLDMLSEYPALPRNPGLPWILISSFDHRAILELRQIGCRWPLAPISSGIPIFIDPLIEAIQPFSWHFDDEYIDFELLNTLNQQNILCLVYTVNSIERARVLQRAGVAGVFTDYPSKMLQTT